MAKGREKRQREEGGIKDAEGKRERGKCKKRG